MASTSIVEHGAETAPDTGERGAPGIGSSAITDRRRARPSLSSLGARGWQLIGAVGGAAVVVWLLLRIDLVVISCLLALFVTATLQPIHLRLRRDDRSGTLAALLTTVGFVVAILAVFALVGFRFVQQVPELMDRLSEALIRLREQFPGLPLPENGNLDMLLEQARDRATQGWTAGMRTAAQIGTGGVLTLVLTFFLLRDGHSMWCWFVGICPRPNRADIDRIGRAAYGTVSQYVRGLAVVAVADAVLSGVALLLLGVPLASALAVLTFFGAFIPTVGAFVVGGIAVAVAFAHGGASLALIVLAVYTAIQQIDGNVLHPWIMGNRLPLHPAAVVLALTAGGLLAGIVGALLAVPVVAAVVAAARRYEELALNEDAAATSSAS